MSRLPDGTNTMLGRWFAGGVNLSGGETQRIALARAFVRPAPILILDEPSAAMDETGQKLISQIVQDQLAHGSVIIATNQKEDRDFATHTISLA